MSVWALGDLHLFLGTPEKNMEFLNPLWENYMKRIEKNWRKKIKEEDLILIPGDISWAATLEKAQLDLEWIATLPGTKLLLKGNHDYWWPSSKKLKAALPPSIYFIYNDTFKWEKISIGGSRLWESPEYHFDAIVITDETLLEKEKLSSNALEDKQNAKIFERELCRLEMSLSLYHKEADLRIAMTHYPPIGIDLKQSRAAKILEKYQVNIAIFGHLHNVKKKEPLFGKKRGISYVLTSADYLNFDPLMLVKPS